MNNKGFAISTVIYGLSIMGILLMAIIMGTMASNRANTRELVKEIEDDLNRFSKTETGYGAQVNGDIPKAQEFTVPEGEGGWYRIELWGAQGGGSNGGLGAYTSGIIELKESDHLYFYVGKHQSSGNGRETDVRIESGGYTAPRSYLTRIMVAAGGGSDVGACGGTLYGYQNSMVALGGYINAQGINKDYGLITTGSPTNNTLAGFSNTYTRTNRTESVTSPIGINNGGDGYFPGTSSAIGGSSFISGYAGCNAVVKGTLSSNTLYKYYQSEYNEAIDSYSYNDSTERDYYFVDGMMLEGVNQGDGKAKIERVVVKDSETVSLPRKNTKLDSVRYIRDCVATSNTTKVWNKISAIMNGFDVGVGKTLEAESIVGSQTCRIIDLGNIYKLDEVAVWHQDGLDYVDHTMEVSSDMSNWNYIRGHATNIDGTAVLIPPETETVAGVHISAYQYDSTQPIPETGNYYLLPVLSENRVVSANESADLDANPIHIEYLGGYRRQIWSIELIKNENINPNKATVNEYKIVELARNKAMSIYQDENIISNKIAANTHFNTNARNEPQLWKIIPVGNGTYVITTVVNVFDSGNYSGNILPQTNVSVSDDYNNIIIGKNNILTQRFKLIALDYSSK